MAYADQPLSIDVVLALGEGLTTPPSPLDNPQRLHARVLAGDPGALEYLDAVFLKVVPARLERTFPRAPVDFAMDACGLPRGESDVRLSTRKDGSNQSNGTARAMVRDVRDGDVAGNRPCVCAKSADANLSHGR
jgi:hypothetical protein